MDPAEFNDVYLHDALEKLSNENTTGTNNGQFQYIDSSTFLDKMYSSLLLPYISSPSQLTSQSQTLIDNIFFNNIEEDIINSGNLTSIISDHCAQFLLSENTNQKKKNTLPQINSNTASKP